ncbi:CidA/LrgA family protein [Bradyrhizobium sp. WD16]|uniref:CidA/LrgA family protein n=1 Tax=Bradyrhizobium sp. WD16 TaxID=1521768 RepID=UPI0020A45B45|nr:CidA/LrgA family protein [Bradyrhizobium sp. WD16]UTD27525.1 CidA/LrgA family protein [Bradyrhizobium sp. WD16]
MIASLGLILICQLVGEVCVRGAGVPIPGPVVGFVLLMLLLMARDQIPLVARGPLTGGAVETTAKGLLRHLSLMFVPAGVGVVQKLDLIASHGFAVFAALALSVIITMVVTVASFVVAGRWLAPRG